MVAGRTPDHRGIAGDHPIDILLAQAHAMDQHAVRRQATQSIKLGQLGLRGRIGAFGQMDQPRTISGCGSKALLDGRPITGPAQCVASSAGCQGS